MILNASPPQIIGRQYQRQRQESQLMEAMRQPNQTYQLSSARNQPPERAHAGSAFFNSDQQNNNNKQQAQSSNQALRLDEDASELLTFVINGGPKWGFRIKQLNDNRVIVSRLNKGPAEKCGLKVNDEILSVNNVPLLNQPRSLLINDYPEQNLASSSEKGALLDNKENALEVAAAAAVADQFLAPIGVHSSLELSKIDFAYQLIKHSSISNKLVLTVKRYLNAAYARASVAATSHSFLTDRIRQPEEPAEKKSSHHSGVQYAYKCCECYCDNEGEYYDETLVCFPFTFGKDIFYILYRCRLDENIRILKNNNLTMR